MLCLAGREPRPRRPSRSVSARAGSGAMARLDSGSHAALHAFVASWGSIVAAQFGVRALVAPLRDEAVRRDNGAGRA